MRSPTIENIIWTLVVLLFVVIIMLVVYLKILRKNIRVKDRKSKEYTINIEQMLIEYLYLQEGSVITLSQKKIINKFKKGLLFKNKRRIITTVFIKLSDEISGTMINNMHELYEEIGLLKFAFKKLRSRKWNVIALGIRDLRQFKIKRAEKHILPFVNHSRREVRSEAQLYFLELFEFDGLNFLDTLKVPLSDWDQIQLLGEIKKFDNHKINDVSRWLLSENDYVIVFMLHLVRSFNLLETKDLLLDLLNHKNEDVRLRTIQVLTHFEIEDAKEILTNKYEELTKKEKISFFKLLKATAKPEDSMFIVNFVKDANFEIKWLSLQILKNINKQLYDNLEKTSEDESYNKFIHLLDSNYGN